MEGEEHRKGGKFNWDRLKVCLYLSPNQAGGKSIKGDKLRKELAAEPVFNANALDYLLANPRLIPDDWKVDEQGRTCYIFFWGTIYRDSVDLLCVRCLCFKDGRWQAVCAWLGVAWDVQYPALCEQVSSQISDTQNS